LWAVLIFVPVVALQIWRLIIMLQVQGVPLSYWTSTKLTFAGNFFNFALPGTTGGDLIKAYYLTLYTPLKTEAVTTVFLDRAIGLLGLVILAALCWSTAGIFITRTVQGGGVTPLGLAFWRVAVTFACLFVALLAFRRDSCAWNFAISPGWLAWEPLRSAG
jgi:uncharacterized membrane protein YbhN (UPF0104 family)